MTDGAFDILSSAANPAMVVVTTCADGARAGCLVGFHTQAGMEPPHYAVWLSKANHTYRVALEASHLAVHFLTADDARLAEHFGTVSGADTDKFAGLDVEEGPDGTPLLGALPHRLVGRRTAVLDTGADHVHISLEIESASRPAPFTPLQLQDVIHLRPGHEATERAVPPAEGGHAARHIPPRVCIY